MFREKKPEKESWTKGLAEGVSFGFVKERWLRSGMQSIRILRLRVKDLIWFRFEHRF